MKKTLKEHFIETSALRKQYRDWLRSRIEGLESTIPSVALRLQISQSVLVAIDSMSDDLYWQRQEKRQSEIDLINANITALRIALSDIAHQTMQTKSFEERLKKIEEREEKTRMLQESFEHFVEKKSEEIKKQEEKRLQDAEKNPPGVA
jgi:alpha/beta superfamily hydrolase